MIKILQKHGFFSNGIINDYRIKSICLKWLNMSILIEKARYLIKMDTIWEIWHIWHPCGIVHLMWLKINHIDMTNYDTNVHPLPIYFGEIAIVGKDVKVRVEI